jgi:hypothetical protein
MPASIEDTRTLMLGWKPDLLHRLNPPQQIRHCGPDRGGQLGAPSAMSVTRRARLSGGLLSKACLPADNAVSSAQDFHDA